MALTGENLVERMSAAELERAARVEAVLPQLRDRATEVDRGGEFCVEHVATLSEAGLLGLIIPQAYGGLGGGLRDLAATTFAMGSACPSTALAYFFHCSAASRGMLALEALEAGLFNSDEAPQVERFAEKVLYTMGRDSKWLANFASESVKSESAAITINTEATPVDGGFQVSGIKSFGCATGVADRYLITANLAGHKDASGLCTFFVDRDASGVSEREKWDALGMRGTATHGLVLEKVFVADEDALAVPGAFIRCMQMSRGSFVGNQLASLAVYAGAAWSVYNTTIAMLNDKTFADTGRPLGTSPMHQQLIGEMLVDLESAMLWLRRQLELETSEPPLLDKQKVVQRWRLCKGQVAEHGFRVAVNALKCAGTSGTSNSQPYARTLREMAMSLVQAFPAERGRLMAAQIEISEDEQAQFGVKTS
ncbi:MAG: acyl-CoA/acyl-ACP dehydrogenase [Gammaproteobacteria bacterium]|nr:acyl-CoA/acyl-ACP dehydrogenase [Gammaproteobacteria bacterium]